MRFLRPLMILFLSSALLTGAGSAKPTPLSEEDYAVYSALLQGLRYGERLNVTPSLIVLGRETSGTALVRVRPSRWREIFREIGVEPEKGLVADFIRKNKVPSVLEAGRFSGVQARLYAPRRTARRELVIDWDAFRREYPGAYGLTELSRVGYARAGTLALVRAEAFSPEGGVAYTVILGKKGGQWAVEHQAVKLTLKKGS